jgi:hypothetical protein
MKRDFISAASIIIGLVALSFSSCQKTELTQTASANDVYNGSLSAVFADELVAMTETQQLSATNGGVLSFSNGAVLNIPPNSFIDAENNLIVGSIDVSVAVISGNAEMARVNIPSTSDGGMLLSGGVVNIEAMQNGRELFLDGVMDVSIPNSFENNTIQGAAGSLLISENDMEFFMGLEQQDGSVNWMLDTSVTINFNTQTNTFDFFTTEIGFINCDVFSYDPVNCGPNSDESCYVTISIPCPDGFDPLNVEVWIYFNDYSSLLGVPYNTQTNTFEISNLLGEQIINYIVLATDNGGYYTLSPNDMQDTLFYDLNHSLELNEGNMIYTTKEQWINMLESLP